MHDIVVREEERRLCQLIAPVDEKPKLDGDYKTELKSRCVNLWKSPPESEVMPLYLKEKQNFVEDCAVRMIMTGVMASPGYFNAFTFEDWNYLSTSET